MRLPKKIDELWDRNARVAVVSLPDELNPLAAKKVRIWGVIPPLANIKFLTALGLLAGAKDAGALEGVRELVECTSGNTGAYLAPLAPIFGVPKVTCIVRADLPEGKRVPLVMAGANVVPQRSGISGIAMARSLGGGGYVKSKIRAEGGVLNLDQYGNPHGPYFHRQWLGPKISDALGEISVFASAIGTGGTIIGLSDALRDRCAKIHVVGGLCAPGHEAPGARDERQMQEITLPWRAAIDSQFEVETRAAYLAAMWIQRNMQVSAGPTAGLALTALMRTLLSADKERRLDEFRGSKMGEIRAAFLIPDSALPYGDRFMANIHGAYLQGDPLPPLCELVKLR